MNAAEVFAKQIELANAESHLDGLKFDNPQPGVNHHEAVDRAERAIQQLRDEVSAAQDSVGGVVFLIPEYNVPLLDEKLAKLNKRAEKLGVEPVGLTLHETLEKKTGKNAYGEAIYTVFQHVAVRGTSPKLAGWQFAATLEHDENGVIVRRLPSLDPSIDLTMFRNASPDWCEQCQTRRRRTDTYIVVNEEGTLKQVGSTCLRDFLGGQSPERIAQWLSFVADLLDDLGDSDSEFFGGDRAPARENTLTYLTHVACMIRLNGWTSRGSAYNYGGYATADAAADNLFNQRGRKLDRQGCPLWTDPIEADAATAQAAIEYVQALDESELANDYVYNLFTSLKGESTAKRQFGIAASAITFYNKAVEKRLKAEKTAESNYVGEVGQKGFSAAVTITKVVSIEDNFSYSGGSKPMYLMQDADGNVIKWVASKWIDGMDQGTEGTITGTIKAHDDGKGKYGDKNYGKSTVLTRCKWAA